MWYLYIRVCIHEPLLTSYSFWLQLLINLCRLGGLLLGGFENKRGGMAASLAKRSILTDLHELILYKKFSINNIYKCIHAGPSNRISPAVSASQSLELSQYPTGTQG